MNIEYMELAYNEAIAAFLENEVPVGAIIVKNDKIIARAHNLREKNKQACAHAEILAIQKACKKLEAWRLEDCDMYVTLEPCSMCASALQQARIKRVVYGAIDEKNGALGGLYDLFLIPKQNHYPLIFVPLQL